MNVSGSSVFTGTRVRQALVLLSLAVIAGCGNVLATRDAHSYALDGGIADGAATAGDGSQKWSGGYVTPLPDGDEAFGARLALISNARSTIDIKTFIFSDDPAGRRFAAALLEAADRGVEIRVLVDDFFHYWANDDLTRLSEHPKIEVRVFNPFNRYIPPPFSFLLDYGRVNRRMHGKVMVVDGTAAIVGGRNIGDEYFRLNPEEYFSDFDLLVRGAPVAGIRQGFSQFWVDRYSIPYAEVIRKSSEADRPKASDVHMSTSNFATDVKVPVRASAGPAFDVRVHTRFDPPEKLRAEAEDGPFEVAEGVFGLIAGARSEVLIVTPYFIPEDFGVRLLESLVRRGVRVRVLTNSLGATNHPSVHGAYLRYRPRLLRAGVEIFEYRENVTHAFRSGTTIRRPKTTMHTKLIVVDDLYTVVGSANFDPRSFRGNTELAMTVHGREFADWSKDWIERVINDLSYRVALGPDRSMVWHDPKGGEARTITKEPTAGLSAGLVAAFFNLMPLDDSL